MSATAEQVSLNFTRLADLLSSLLPAIQKVVGDWNGDGFDILGAIRGIIAILIGL